MKPPYEITGKVLKLIADISERIGAVNATYLGRQSPQLRKQNRIKTIQASLNIEGNTLSTEQVTAIVENKRVIGPKKDIQEVLNAIAAYNKLGEYKASSEKSFLEAHKVLMQGLLTDAGKYRKQGVGIAKGENVSHVAPSHQNVPYLMKDLFDYLKNEEELSLIKSCVFHYEMEFIHPFLDGNGRMGRLWQTIILMEEYPAFEYLPFETLISKDQKRYYKALSASDNEGKSTIFLEYMLGVIHESLSDILNYRNRVFTDIDRIEFYFENGLDEFTRKDYMNTFKAISSATASRDLAKGIKLGLFEKIGTLNKTIYQKKKK